MPKNGWPALFMTVRCEIVEPRCETGVRSREDPMRTRAVRWGSEGRARWPTGASSPRLRGRAPFVWSWREERIPQWVFSFRRLQQKCSWIMRA